jgi:hypothetical protein
MVRHRSKHRRRSQWYSFLFQGRLFLRTRLYRHNRRDDRGETVYTFDKIR